MREYKALKPLYNTETAERVEVGNSIYLPEDKAKKLKEIKRIEDVKTKEDKKEVSTKEEKSLYKTKDEK